jgi:hypothetical protein
MSFLLRQSSSRSSAVKTYTCHTDSHKNHCVWKCNGRDAQLKNQSSTMLQLPLLPQTSTTHFRYQKLPHPNQTLLAIDSDRPIFVLTLLPLFSSITSNHLSAAVTFVNPSLRPSSSLFPSPPPPPLAMPMALPASLLHTRICYRRMRLVSQLVTAIHSVAA